VKKDSPIREKGEKAESETSLFAFSHEGVIALKIMPVIQIPLNQNSEPGKR
jgi:hypothetical protein